MKRLLLFFALPLAFAACDRNPAGRSAEVVLVQVMPDERTLAVGETLALELTVRDRDGEVPAESEMAKVQWSTDAPAVATVSPQGVVTGVGPGTATIRAELQDESGSVRVTVAAAPADCTTAGTLRSPAVGGAIVLGGIAAATVCLSGGAAGAEYVAVPYYAGRLDAGFASVQVGLQGVVPVAATSPSVAPLLSAAREREPDEEFHQRLRLRAERELARHVDAALAYGRGATGLQPSHVLNLRNPSLGQEVQVNTSTATSCDNPSLRTGRVVAIGSRSIVLADVGNPSGGLTDAEYASFAAGFDTLVYPTVTAAFGEPRDVDGNSRVVIFYTRAVNELTPPGSGSYVGGFFHPRDLFPTRERDGLAACAASNFAEMMYMLVPDPTGSVNGTAFSRDLVLQTSLSTMAHEFQHLINASRRLYVVGTTHWNEETWLNEAMSHVTEELVFYRAAGLNPRQNLTAAQIQGNARALAAFRSYMDQNMRRYEKFLEDPETQSPYDVGSTDANDLPTRGAGWAFLRYATDRRAGTDAEFFRTLVDGSTVGFANLQRALGADARVWIRDWTTSVFTDDVAPGVEARFQQPSWAFRTFFTTFPLRTRRVTGPGTVEAVLKSGSGAFVRFGVLPGGVATVTGRSAGQPLPSSVYLTIVRTK